MLGGVELWSRLRGDRNHAEAKQHDGRLIRRIREVPTLKLKIAELKTEREQALERAVRWEEIALAAGISAAYVRQLASADWSGNTNINLVERLCRFFECGIEEMIEFDPPLPRRSKRRGRCRASRASDNSPEPPRSSRRAGR